MSARHMPSGPALALLAAERASLAEVSRIREAADAFDECTEDIVRRRMAGSPLHTLFAEISRSEDFLREETLIQERGKHPDFSAADALIGEAHAIDAAIRNYQCDHEWRG